MQTLRETAIRGMLNEVGAVLTAGHFVYTSGKHGDTYINKDALYPHTQQTSTLCAKLAKYFQNDGIDVVIGPVIGGVILSTWTAHHLTDLLKRPILALYAEKEADAFVIKRGYDQLLKSQRVLVVEDVLTTGGSVRKVVSAVRSAGGTVVGVGALCNRGHVTNKQIGNVRLISLLDVAFEAWDEADCPLCREGVLVNTEVGKGREFLAKKAALT